MEESAEKTALSAEAQSLGTSSQHLATVASKEADETLTLLEDVGSEVDTLSPRATGRLKRKLYSCLLLQVIAINLMLFIDKATLSEAVFLGLLDDFKLSDKKYNDLNTIFYTGYIVGQIPGQYLIQRLPLGKFVSGSIFLWAVIILLHCTATNYGGLIPLRFFLGFVESALTPAMETSMSMFFTPNELQQVQPIFWISCVGSTIPAGLIAYGLLFSKSTIAPWKFFMIITGGVTFLLSISSYCFFPDNPAKARFLTTEEKVQVIRRVHDTTKSSIEQKTFKKHQFYEALRDPISWLFGLASFCLMLANNLTFQMSLLLVDLGVSNLGSTLVTVASGGFAVAVSLVAWILLRLFPGYGAWWAAFWVLPGIAGGIGMVALDWNQTLPLLACLILATSTWAQTYIISFAWASSSSAGYTKKLTRNAIFMVAYGIANIISPQMWVTGGPRYYGSWIASIVVSFVLTPVLLLVIRFVLARRNKERRMWIAEQAEKGNHGEGFIERRDPNGETVKVKVDVSLLDLTDLENKFFLYPL
ncbi:Major facilitator superfamily domain general substrate transporter [Penicillium chermesinum]|uniref:Major facilitator superfamily domain general substrate transporter n=1 Tax=Penicillium chermesinum TaxID=63820 RepID=A0A9W9TYH8_9EURO|nr:Major facilitator superfamily domain general substrate transporter [Penicillium chermesinum]KAJ5249082.1 Major facilitator superfamily domain general substrate transporter [Penicillium chermesinum]